jgi:hypothetical protein
MARRLTSSQILLLFTVSVFLMVELPRVLVLGKNGDGTEYAAVARNMAEGFGTFWRPYLSDTSWPVHHEQPPLQYGIQAVLFRFFGESDYFEGFYGLAVGGIVLALTALLWRALRRDCGLPERGSWWALLLLLSVSQFLYHCQSNRMIFTHMVWALLSVFFASASLLRTSRTAPALAVAAGACVYLGFLTKGPVALFAVVVPLVGAPCLGVSWSRGLSRSALIAGTFAAAFLATLLVSADARDYWADFLDHQIVDSLAGAREARESRFELLEKFTMQIIGPLGLLGTMLLVLRISPRRLKWSGPATFVLVVALAGSLPFFFQPRQKVRYILHTWPLFAIVLALVSTEVMERVEAVLERRPRFRRGLLAAPAACLIVGLGLMIHDKDRVSRAHAFFEDVYLQDLGIPPRATVTVIPRRMIYGDYLFAFMQRHLKLSLSREPGHDYILVSRDEDFEPPPDFRRLNAEGEIKYRIYGRTESGL